VAPEFRSQFDAFSTTSGGREDERSVSKMEDLYFVLGVPRDASAEAVKKAYLQ
jgi:hypothetical protein